MKTKQLIVENGIIAGNIYDKYGTANPVARHLVEGFIRSVKELCSSVNACDIHEIGCGEGHISIALAKLNGGVRLRACDLSQQVIKSARDNAIQAGVDINFKVASIYNLKSEKDAAELVICCEVLEHLEYPERALEVLSHLASPYLLVSVPCEPMWSVLNIMRGKYVSQMGNTPGHIQRWSKTSFIHLLSNYVDIIKVLTPLPWIVVLCRTKNLADFDNSLMV